MSNVIRVYEKKILEDIKNSKSIVILLKDFIILNLEVLSDVLCVYKVCC